MGRSKRFALELLIALCLYGYLAVGLSYFIARTSSYSFEDEKLTTVKSLGRFACGQFSIIKYEFGRNEETVTEMNFMCLILGKDVAVRTERQEDGTLVIVWARKGDRLYKKTLRDHPEVLAEAEKVLQLGRDKFAEAKKKLEEQKSKSNQSDRLG